MNASNKDIENNSPNISNQNFFANFIFSSFVERVHTMLCHVQFQLWHFAALYFLSCIIGTLSHLELEEFNFIIQRFHRKLSLITITYAAKVKAIPIIIHYESTTIMYINGCYVVCILILTLPFTKDPIFSQLVTYQYVQDSINIVFMVETIIHCIL